MMLTMFRIVPSFGLYFSLLLVAAAAVGFDLLSH